MSVHFRFDWVDAGPSPDVLAQHTMAALSVDAGGAVITGALDRQSGTYSRNVVVPLFSIAEWLVTNWWHLWYEVGDVSEPHPAFEARHNLAFASDGFVLPRLRMVTTTGRIRLEWTRYQPAHARIEFVDAGQHEVEREATVGPAPGSCSPARWATTSAGSLGPATGCSAPWRRHVRRSRGRSRRSSWRLPQRCAGRSTVAARTSNRSTISGMNSASPTG